MSDPNPSDPTPADGTAPERARIDGPSNAKRLDLLPMLYVLGFLVLAGGLFWVWQHPSPPRGAAQNAARVASLQQDIAARKAEADALEARLKAVEARPVPDLGPIEARLKAVEAKEAAPTDLAPLQARIAALEQRPEPAPVDLGPLRGRVAALEEKPPVDLQPLEARIAALEAKPPVDLTPLRTALAAQGAALSGKIEAVGARLDGVNGDIKQLTDRLGTMEAAAQRRAQMEVASIKLASGQPLGTIAGAPPALARFAQQSPPTEAGLRLTFDNAAAAAAKAADPVTSSDMSFTDRMWARAQQSVTVRQGDKVLVGNPVGGLLDSARQALEAGDLASAVRTLDGLTGPAKAAMADWLGQAHALLDARTAVAEMAARR